MMPRTRKKINYRVINIRPRLTKEEERRYIEDMLNGRKIITDTDVLKIANALDVEVNALFEERRDKED